MSSGKKKHKKQVRNKTKDWLMDYYQTGREFDKENRRRQEEEGFQAPKGLKDLNSFEWGCIIQDDESGEERAAFVDISGDPDPAKVFEELGL